MGFREELKDKLSELKRYEEKMEQATSYYNRAEGYSGEGNYATAKSFYAKSEKPCEDAPEILSAVLQKVKEAAELDELNVLIEQQAQFGGRVTQKDK